MILSKDKLIFVKVSEISELPCSNGAWTVTSPSAILKKSLSSIFNAFCKLFIKIKRKTRNIIAAIDIHTEAMIIIKIENG